MITPRHVIQLVAPQRTAIQAKRCSQPLPQLATLGASRGRLLGFRSADCIILSGFNLRGVETISTLSLF